MWLERLPFALANRQLVSAWRTHGLGVRQVVYGNGSQNGSLAAAFPLADSIVLHRKAK